MLKLVLVDDEPLALERLRTLFTQIPETHVIGTAANAKDAAELIRKLDPDIVLLDIQMPGLTGLTLANSISADDRPEIIFVTAFSQYAADAFELDATDYLLKPVSFGRLRHAIEKAKRRQLMRRLLALDSGSGELEPRSTQRDHPEPLDGIWVHSRDKAVFVDFDSIRWIEAQRDYVLLHTSTRSHLIRMSMRSLESRLASTRLVRVHRSAFARVEDVVEVTRIGKTINGLNLKDGATVPVGRSYSQAVAKMLGTFANC